MPRCPIHPHVELLCPACVGRTGGQSTSEAKVAAARKNATKGGRPKGSKNRPK